MQPSFLAKLRSTAYIMIDYQDKPTSASQNPLEKVDLFSKIPVLWRNKLLILAILFASTAAGAFYAFRVATPLYTSTATLVLQVENANVVDIDSVVSGNTGESSALNTEVEVILSRGILERVVDELALIEDPDFNSSLKEVSQIQKWILGLKTLLNSKTPLDFSPQDIETKIRNNTIDELKSAISVFNARDTYIFNIRATTSDPEKSKKIANTLSEKYIEDQVRVKQDATERAVQWLSEKVIDLEDELRNREKSLKEFRSEANMASIEALEFASARISDTRGRIRSLQSEIEELVENLQNLDTARRLLNSTNFTPSSLKDVRRVILEVSPDFPRPIIADNEAQADRLLSSIIQFEESQRSSLEQKRSQIESLSQSLTSQLERSDQLSADFNQLQQLEREANVSENLYETFLSRLKEADIQRGLQQADSRMLSPAISGVYVSPNKKFILLLSGLFGLVLGSAISLIRDNLNNSITSSDEVENDFGLSVVGEIPLVSAKTRKDFLDILKRDNTSNIAESVRNLRTSIMLSQKGEPPQVIMSTSSVPGEGKTTNSLALASNLSMMGKKVILIEADTRRRTLQQYFPSFKGGRGLISAIYNPETLHSSIHRFENYPADIIFGDSSEDNAADIFSSQEFIDLLEQVKDIYDFVIIDTPPVLAVPDARIIARACDYILYTVRWNYTTKGQFSEGIRQIQSINLSIGGVALSQISKKGNSYYGYGNYSQR